MSDNYYNLTQEYIDFIKDEAVGEYSVFEGTENTVKPLSEKKLFGNIKMELEKHLKEGKYSLFYCDQRFLK